MRILAVDPGRSRVGLAICNDEEQIAFPLCTVYLDGSMKKAVEGVGAAVREQGVESIVVGLPLRLDGREGQAAFNARRLGAAIEEHTKIEVIYYDERMTTALAERAMRATRTRGRAARDVIDQAAATVLLQGYLDWRREKKDSAGD